VTASSYLGKKKIIAKSNFRKKIVYTE